MHLRGFKLRATLKLTIILRQPPSSRVANCGHGNYVIRMVQADWSDVIVEGHRGVQGQQGNVISEEKSDELWVERECSDGGNNSLGVVAISIDRTELENERVNIFTLTTV